MAFEDCNSFMSHEEQKSHSERVSNRWTSFFLLALLSALLILFSGENSFWAIWVVFLIAGAFYVDGTN